MDDLSSTVFSKDYIHFCLDPRLQNNSTHLKLIDHTVTPNLTKWGLSALFFLALHILIAIALYNVFVKRLKLVKNYLTREENGII